MDRKRRVIFSLLLFLCSFINFSVEAANRVEDVSVEIVSEQSVPPKIRERMAESVKTIGSQILAGEIIEKAAAKKSEKECIIHQVFDKILVGYSVRKVTVSPSETAKITVELIPWRETIKSVSVDINIEGMPKEVETLVRQDLAGITNAFDEVLTGLPVAAADWSNGVLKSAMKDYFAKNLPEFWGDFDIDVEKNTKINLNVFPKLPVVRTAELFMRSDTLPNLMLFDRREVLDKETNKFIGVPVAFINRHKESFEGSMAKKMDSFTDFKKMGVTTKVSVSPAENLSVTSRSNAKYYRIRVSGEADVGRKRTDDDMRFRLHAGRFISDDDEIFFAADVYPKNIRIRPAVGYMRKILKSELTFKYDFNAKKIIAGVTKDLGYGFLVRYEYRWTDKMWEAALRYKLHDFIGLEYVRDKDDRWLRIISNF